MAGKGAGTSANARIEVMEEIVGTVQEQVGLLRGGFQEMMQRMKQMMKMQEEALKTASTAEKDQIPPTNVEAQSPNGVVGGGSSSQGYQFDRKPRRLEMPTFEGSNPDNWILKAERFFSFQRYNNEEKIEAAVISFEANALIWYQWESKRRPILFWEELKGLLLKQFRVNQEGFLCEQFLALRQEGSVADYRRRFVTLAAPLDTVTEDVYLSKFINGLKPVIRVEVRMLEPGYLGPTMELAQRVEEKQALTGLVRSGLQQYHNRAWASQKHFEQGPLGHQPFAPSKDFNKSLG